MNGKRQSNIEVLRVFSMFLIVVMHYIFCGLKQNPLHTYYDVRTISDGVNYLTMEPLYLLSQVAVNCYVMITGYFLIDRFNYRWGGILRVLVQTLFYSLLFLGGVLLLDKDVTKIQLLKSIFPIHQWGYWFVTVYIGLLLVAPLLSRIANTLDRKQYQLALAILFVLNFSYLYGGVYGGHRTILFFGFLFLIAGYLRLYGAPKMLIKHKYLFFFGLWLLLAVFATIVNLKKGQFELIGTSYDGPILFLSIATFILFTTSEMESTVFKAVAKLSPYTFGVYLLHTNCFVNDWLWNKLPSSFDYPIVFHCLLFCVVVYIICTIFDYLRSRLFQMVSLEKLIDFISKKIPQL